MNKHTIAKPAKARLPVWRRLGVRLGASFLLVTAVGIFLSGLLQYWNQKERLQQDLGSRLLSIAGTGALLLDGDMHQRVVKEGRKDTAAHKKIRSQLLRIEKTNQLRDRVYTLVDVKGDKAKFAVFSRGEEAIGKPYSLAEETQPILHEVLKKGKPAYTDIYTNVHGTWITAFAPIQNTAGQTVAALEVDYRVDVYLEQLRAIQLSLYIYSLAGAVLALVAGVLLARQITRPIGQLSTMAHRVVEGDLTTPERITSQDEIGLLGLVQIEGVGAPYIECLCPRLLQLGLELVGPADPFGAGEREEPVDIGVFEARGQPARLAVPARSLRRAGTVESRRGPQGEPLLPNSARTLQDQRLRQAFRGDCGR